MIQEIVKFKATDGVTIDGFLNKCENTSNKIVIQIHGMTSNCFRIRDEIIAKELNKIGVDSLAFNNRGSEIAKFIKNSDGKKKLAGSAFEEITESYFDICGAIDFVLKKGYKDIILQGHSLGSTKSVYVYNRILKEKMEFIPHIKALVLLSLVDLPMVVKHYGKDYIELAEEKVKLGEDDYIMSVNSFPYPLSAKVFLRYVKNNDDIDFAKFGTDDKFEVLNSFKIPLFFRWGNVGEILSLDVNNQIEFVKNKVKNSFLYVGYIDGADHSYHGKEEQLAKEITNFINNI